MPIQFQSPLSNLCDVLTKVKDSAQLYNAILKKNEASTRAVLIDPILRSLGWDTANPHMVEIEKTLGQTRADYVLNDQNNRACVIIEAKSLGTNIFHDQAVNSLVSYAFHHKTSDVFITDGLVWHHYHNFDPNNFTPSRIFDLTTQDVAEVAGYLIQKVDAAHFWSVETIDKLAEKVDDLERLVYDLKSQVAALSVPSVASKPKNTQRSVPVAKPPQVSKPVPSIVGRTLALSHVGNVKGTKPSVLCLPDGTQKAVSAWSGVLKECCLYCLQQNPSLQMPFPDASGKSLFLFSFDKPHDDRTFFEATYQNKTVYIYANYSAPNCVENALHALEQVKGIKGGEATVTFS